jgi:hypothetical protein
MLRVRAVEGRLCVKPEAHADYATYTTTSSTTNLNLLVAALRVRTAVSEQKQHPGRDVHLTFNLKFKLTNDEAATGTTYLRVAPVEERRLRQVSKHPLDPLADQVVGWLEVDAPSRVARRPNVDPVDRQRYFAVLDGAKQFVRRLRLGLILLL